MTLDVNKMDNASDEFIAKEIVDIERAIAELTEDRKELLAELARRLEASIGNAFTKATKTHGKVTIVADGFSLDVDRRQTVKWDQAKLREAADRMSPAEARHLIDVELSMSERNYNALPPGDVKKALTDARTTKLSAPSIKVVFPGEKS